ncbi:hypothetical protein FRACYDRAFT_238501 [Fragilariopsis cylindrus CCMP1102]|uniref:EF-hand domain-containing protein n=1 Tax=Fragilariopsis cylindrus CCMP1102 TaxID=635003 RepID=A0A1E7FIU4_9STRA|nr:hypothetical protein FRACYDRAFT_238501 [Fragilariopsis cylindrus CCMP1102]|eukprot:OEU18068.1 hypothetical protein FRACYDRAFT_238501 [Fragilariopsis cylindrus CCMP1102]
MSSSIASHTPAKPRMRIDISKLPRELRECIDEFNLDVNRDGELDSGEIILAVDKLASKSKDNNGLKKIIYGLCGLCLFAVLSAGCIFGATIAAARLAKDTEVDSASGIMYAKGSHKTMKTEDVMIYSSATNTIIDMSNDELNVLKVILLTDGNVKFQIKGYARSMNTDNDDDDQRVKLLVEGGTITYDNAGIVSATGDAQELLEFAYGVNTNSILASALEEEIPACSPYKRNEKKFGNSRKKRGGAF